jgi:hypothetical protein
MRFQSYKKKIKDFLADESSKISRKNIIKIGVYTGIASLFASGAEAVTFPVSCKTDPQWISQNCEPAGYTVIEGKAIDGYNQDTEQKLDYIFQERSAVMCPNNAPLDDSGEIKCQVINHKNSLDMKKSGNELIATHNHDIKECSFEIQKLKTGWLSSDSEECENSLG